MAPFAQERPSIHVSFMPDSDPSLYRWVQIGAEEEGVPCQRAEEEATDLVALAYAAAQSSRFNIGVGVGSKQVVLHESHMPPQEPVLVFDYVAEASIFCRLMGSNAARMIVRRPFRFADGPTPFGSNNDSEDDEQVVETVTAPPTDKPDEAASPNLITDPAQIATIVAAVVRKLQERGIQ